MNGVNMWDFAFNAPLGTPGEDVLSFNCLDSQTP